MGWCYATLGSKGGIAVAPVAAVQGLVRCTPALLAVLSLSLVTGGCATITTGGFQTISVMTEPEGADCTFARDGIVIARVNPTPGAVLVGKGSGPIAVLCRKDGYHDTAGTTGSEFQAMTLGNILLGGLIGVIVDAGSGAMMKYPESVTFVLVPQEFASATDRDAFFANLSRTFLVEYEEVVGRIRKSCAPTDCEQQLRAADTGRTAKLAEIEQKRTLARVQGPDDFLKERGERK
jgi:hypothetical protein